VLEVGPATGYITKVLKDRGCTVTGIEIDPAAAREAGRFADHMIVGDIEQLDLDGVLGGQRFDVVMFGDVLEHLIDPVAVLREIRSLLKEGGSVVASIPNVAHSSVRLALLTGRFDYTPQGLLDRTHLRFFTGQSIDEMFAEAGFTIGEWRRSTADPFGTEVGLAETEYPPQLVESVRGLPEADTYQFIVRAEPAPTGQRATPADATVDGRAFEPIWELAERAGWLETHVRGLEENARKLESELSFRRELLREKERMIQGAEQITRARDDQLRGQYDRVREMEVQLEGVRQELDRTRSSPAYRVALGTARRARRWAPPATVRGWVLSKMRRAAYRRLERRVARRPEAVSWEHLEEPIAPAKARVTPSKYLRWIHQHEPSEEEIAGQRDDLMQLPYRPLISVVMPTWKPDLALLNHTLQSLLDQTYDRWELCVADGASDIEARRLLSKFRRQDDRMGVRFLDRNQGISGNTNEALRMATGEFVAFVDQSDVLAPFALARVVEELNRNPGLDVLYSDWDVLSEDGHARFNPFFTPEWSPDLLLSTNYMTHLSVVRRSFVESVGGMRPEMDGAQDWDLLLRVTEQTDRVARIPGILYHWRADPSSAVLSLGAKPRAGDAQLRAIGERLRRTGEEGRVERTADGEIRVRWQIRGDPRATVIIPTRHNRELLERCLAALERSTYGNREVIVVETAGRDPEREAWYDQVAERFPIEVLWWERPFNYSAVNNLAAERATGDVLVFLNDDTEALTADWLEELVGWLQRDGVGAVGAQLLSDDGTIQHGGVVVGIRGFAEHLFRGLRPGGWTLMGSADWYRNVSAVTGACLAMSKGAFDRIGGWDERFELCGGDVELGLRLRKAGFRVLVNPFARLRHLEAVTRGSSIPVGDFGVSFWHYQRLLYSGDPYFNPNLSYQHTIPTLRTPEDVDRLSIVSDVLGRDVLPRAPGDARAEAEALVEACRIDPADQDAVARSHASVTGHHAVGTITWFVPDFENPFYGGIHTIFRFADHLQRVHGVKSRFAVIGTGPEEFFRSGLRVTFPDLSDSDVFIVPGGQDSDLRGLPESDAAVCTLWVSAYPMARWHGARRYFSFVQDFEPMFYPAGALFALAEETYRMGFYGVANTPPMKDIYASYGGTATSFTPCVDADIFHDRRPPRKPDEPFTVFMYGRPGHPRNCYELAMAALRRVKASMGDRVRIVTAGSWSPSGGSEPWLDHLGLLGYEETADLYRRCDAGLVLSVSKHPTYIPMQLMACGALVVANHNPANKWLLRDGRNALLAEPTADALAAALERGLSDESLRATLTARAVADIREAHSDWAPEIDRVYRFLCDPEN
jgi:GT2 family glycosyltransferase